MKSFCTDQLNVIWREILVSPITIDVSISNISIDTRNLEKGDAFFAVSGENFDAHTFVDAAIERGANAVVVEVAQDEVSVPQIVVRDTRLALGLLAAEIRKNFTGKVVGLTGSVGKTTNKQMLASIFAQVGETHSTKGNLNNDLGVPLTWFELPDVADYVVIEMGANHQGEIAYLANITCPDVAMITNAGEAHLEGFGGLSGVAKGKGELFVSLGKGKIAVVNADDDYCDYWRDLLCDGVNQMTFSLLDKSSDIYADEISIDGSAFVLCAEDQRQSVCLPTVGEHNVMNALGSAACALSLGVSLPDIAKGLSLFETAQGRLQLHQRGGRSIIDDSYNANPLSVRASAEIVSSADGCRVMVLGDMNELGDDEKALHAQLGKDLSEKADAFFCFGEKMRDFVENNKRAQYFEDLALLNAALLEFLKKEEKVTVLVKGSRSMQMERVVDYLLEALRSGE